MAVLLAVLGTAAALSPSAHADDEPSPLTAAVPEATALVDAALELAEPTTTSEPSPALEVVDELAEAVEAAVEPADPQPAEPAETEASVVEAAEAVVETPAETPAPAPEAPIPAPEAPAPAPEGPAPEAEAPVLAAEAEADPVEAVASAVVQQLQPVNVNISIRVESPGDNGPVSQVNAAIAELTANVTAPAAPETQYQPAEQQYQAPEAEPAAPTPTQAPAATESPAPTAPAPAEQWDWTWSWSCGEAISPDIVLPGSSLVPIWNWNWEWNCGGGETTGGNTETELPTQYHAAAMQYQPINVNISIRILSPGNDGAVTQANVAQSNVAVTIAATSPVRPLPTVLPVPVVLPPTAPSSPSGAGTGGAPATGSAPTSAPGFADAIVELTAGIIALPFGLVVELGCCATAAPGDIATGGAHAAQRPAKHTRLHSTARDVPLGPTAGAGRGDTTATPAAIAAPAPVSAEAIASLAAPEPAVAAARRSQAQEELKQRAVEKTAPARERATRLAYAGVTPVGAADHGFKIALLFLLPFVLAFVDAARRVRDERKAAAAEPGRPEGRPG